MPNPSSNHLRLHGDDRGGNRLRPDFPAWDHLQAAYHQLTGWCLDCQPGPVPGQAQVITTIPQLYADETGALYRWRPTSATRDPAVDPYADELGQAIGGLCAELQATRVALEQREAELATAVPVIARHDDGVGLRQRLEAILRGATEGFGCHAAALYVLDDATTQLKLRSHWGLPSSRFLDPPRPLREAIADLEALAGHVVVIEDTELLSHWNVPEDYKVAVCVPVSSADALLGTFWLFGDDSRDFDSQETQLLEIVAGRLAVELERHVLVQEAAQNSKFREQASEIQTWTDQRAVQIPPLIDGWQIASTPRVGAGGDFATWRLDRDDRLLLACSSIAGSAPRGVLSSTLMQGATRAALRQFESPTVAMQTVNDVLWSSAAGIEPASMFVAALDPKSGQLTFATAGDTDAYILRPHGWEPIVENDGPLGHDAEWVGADEVQTVHPGDVLLIVSHRSLPTAAEGTPWNATSLAEALLRHVHLSAQELADKAMRLMRARGASDLNRAVLVVRRIERSSGG